MKSSPFWREQCSFFCLGSEGCSLWPDSPQRYHLGCNWGQFSPPLWPADHSAPPLPQSPAKPRRRVSSVGLSPFNHSKDKHSGQGSCFQAEQGCEHPCGAETHGQERWSKGRQWEQESLRSSCSLQAQKKLQLGYDSAKLHRDKRVPATAGETWVFSQWKPKSGLTVTPVSLRLSARFYRAELCSGLLIPGRRHKGGRSHFAASRVKPHIL